jgi:tetratricopeptide (TPR) repeat protein
MTHIESWITLSERDNASTWQAFIEWARIVIGKGGQLKRLQQLADSNPESDQTLFYLGRALQQFDQHQLAGDAFLSAMRATESPKKKAKRASDAISQFHAAKNKRNVDETLAELRKLVVGTPSLEAILTEAVQGIVEADKDEPFTIALLERHMELNPDDYDARFRLAFKQSEAGNEVISLHHYCKIPPGERHGMTWNNIGATADQLGLPAKSVAAYNRAAKMGETLAMSNLGFKLMNIGFLELAREQCSNASKNPNPHANVGRLITSLASVEDNEQSHQDDVLNGVDLRRLGRAATLETPEKIAEDWQGSDCVLKFTRRDDRITLEGTYEREVGLGLLSALSVPIAGVAALPVPKRKHSVSYSGKIRGLAVIGEVRRERDGASLLESSGEQKMFMILSEDGDEISVFEGADSSDPVVHVLKRVHLLKAD